MQLSPEMINFYQKYGYLLIDEFFSAEIIKQSKCAINEILEIDNAEDVAEMEPNNTQQARRIWGPDYKHEFFDTMIKNEKLLDAISCLIGNNIIFHYSRINMKPPKIGSPVEWHQDFAYNPHTNTDLITCMLYLDDADRHNGCLQVIPGSHRDGLYDHYIDHYFRGKVRPDKLPVIKKLFL
jgi:ectoine hydroxylase-related dioxygenase (phytanoyl-CoA dioxygenase family)